MSSTDVNDSCPCGSGSNYAECCELYLSGKESPATAEILMRSRYSAYVKSEIQYVHDSLHPSHREDHDQAAARKWSQDSEWLGLEVVATYAGGESDTHGVVEFKASYRDKSGKHQAHEVANFEKIDGKWVYVNGEMPKQETVRRSEKKVGRNDPCPCGSGKKYKKCCGKPS
mgnify:FL=1